MSVHSVGRRPHGHSYAYWSGVLAALLATLLEHPDDELHQQRARRLLSEYEAECDRREKLIAGPEIVPESIRHDLIDA